MEFIGNIYFERGDGASPEVFTRICAVTQMSPIGEENAQVEVTTFCDEGKRRYIGGLADGLDVDFTLNYHTAGDAADGDQIQLLIGDVRLKQEHNYRLSIEADGSPSETYTFGMAPLRWALVPSMEDKNTFTFGGKISGDILINTAA